MYKRTKIEAEVHPRFLCLEEFMNYTGLGRGSAMKLGKEIGCVMKVGKRALYDTRKRVCTNTGAVNSLSARIKYAKTVE